MENLGVFGAYSAPKRVWCVWRSGAPFSKISSEKCTNLGNKVDIVYGRLISIIINDQNGIFQTFLLNYKSVTILHSNLRVLMMEVYKIVRGAAPLKIQNFG